MGNKCGAFLQSYPDAPILHVEKLLTWTGSEVSGAQGKLWDKRLAGRDEWGWRGEKRVKRDWGKEHWLDVQRQGEGSIWMYEQIGQEINFEASFGWNSRPRNYVEPVSLKAWEIENYWQLKWSKILQTFYTNSAFLWAWGFSLSLRRTHMVCCWLSGFMFLAMLAAWLGRAMLQHWQHYSLHTLYSNWEHNLRKLTSCWLESNNWHHKFIRKLFTEVINSKRSKVIFS